MVLHGLLKKRMFRAAARRGNWPRGRSRLFMEPLEHRLLLTTLGELCPALESGIPDDWFGESVAMDDDVVVVGAPRDDANGRDAGAAYVFERTSDGGTPADPEDDQWSLPFRLPSPTGDDTLERRDAFGSSVAVYHHKTTTEDTYTVAVGATKADAGAVTDCGAVFVYADTDLGEGISWAPPVKLTAPVPERSDSFGFRNALSVFDDTIVVGAPYKGTGGEVYVFDAPASGWSSYTGPPTLLAVNSGTAKNATFGRSVSMGSDTVVDEDNNSLEHDTIAVGADGDKAIYVFERLDGGSFTQKAKLTRYDDLNMGWDVAISDTGDTIIGSGMWRVFAYDRGDGWSSAVTEASEEDRLMSDDTADFDDIRFGWSVDISGATVVVGAVGHLDKIAYVFKGSGTDWTEHAKLSPSNPLGGALGSFVATDGTLALVGARDDGKVLVFPTAAPEPTPGVTVNPTAGLETNEDGASATFTVKLETQPTADVTINVVSDDTSEGTVSAGNLTFTTANWGEAQTVTVTGVDDDPAAGGDDYDVSYNIVLGPVTSADSAYALIDPADVSVTNVDNDAPAPAEETHAGATNVELADAHRKNGRAKTTTLTLDIQNTSITSIGTLNLALSIDGGSSGIGDLSARLISPLGTSEPITSPLNSGVYSMSAFGGEPLVGLWTLEITDSVKDSPHVLDSWSLTATPEAAGSAASIAAPAADAALAAWAKSELASDHDSAPIAESLAFDLALTLGQSSAEQRGDD